MIVKKSKGLAGIDIIIAIIAVSIFSTLIFSLMYNNLVENVKLKKETLAMIYMTEIFENIAIADYDDITEQNITRLVPWDITNNYNVNIVISNKFEGIDEDVLKKIQVTLNYTVNNKTYSYSMERIKAKE